MDAGLPAFLGSKVVKRSASFSFEFTETHGFVPSMLHGRSVAVPVSEKSWVLAKGCGWSWGPPWCVVSPKDPELFFGLLDRDSAERELKVSGWIERHHLHAGRSREHVALTDPELELLGVNRHTCFRNGRFVEPVALLTSVLSPYRAQDLLSESAIEANAHLRLAFDTKPASEVLDSFFRKLLSVVVGYQALGAVNDTLGPENVTVAAEIVDFEWFFVPGVPLPDGWEDAQLEQRQRKEAFYLLQTLMVVAKALEVTVSIQSLARDALNHLESDLRRPPIVDQLHELAK